MAYIFFDAEYYVVNDLTIIIGINKFTSNEKKFISRIIN